MIQGPSTTVLPFYELANIVTLNHFDMLPDLPNQYRLSLIHSAKLASNPSTPAPLLPSAPVPSVPLATTTNTCRTTPTATPATASAPATQRTPGHGGSLLTNPALNDAWKQQLQSSNKNIRDIAKHAPTTTEVDENNNTIPAQVAVTPTATVSRLIAPSPRSKQRQ
ncbi:hypothetical protein ACA910_005350 [Epithemia clementina (nom. ined.)]